MSQGIFRNLNNTKVKRFLLFLTLAAIFWVFTKFSREFTAPLSTKIDYVNLPETAALAEDHIKEIDFDITANGFEILYYKFKKPSIEVNVGENLMEDDLQFIVPSKELAQLVALKFGSSRSVKNLSVEDLNVQLDPIVLKMVVVRPVKSISFKEGFKAVDSMNFNPDSVLISGPAKVINDINYIETENFTAKNVDRNLSESVKIRKSVDEIISIKPPEVIAQLAVAEFSQGQFTLPIEVVNLPPNTEVKLVPSTVSIKFDASVNDFTNISKENFRVVCDYSKMNNEGKFMIPFLESQPEGIYNVIFEPKKIDLLIIK